MKHPAKPGSAAAVCSPAFCVVREEITKAAQTAQLLSSDLGSAYQAAEDPVLQIVLLRLMQLTNELRTELTRVHTAVEERC